VSAKTTSEQTLKQKVQTLEKYDQGQKVNKKNELKSEKTTITTKKISSGI
jgi:hypothetical protein